MKKKLNPCSIASAKRRRQNLVLGRGATGDRAWRARARACANASDGEERFCARSVGRFRRYKIVRFPLSSSRVGSKLPSTAGLTDYEVRDLNDEINRLMREKRHWENQIIALGGANYRRNVAMLDDDGREVPGTKGYKYVPLLLSRARRCAPFEGTLDGRKSCLVSKSSSRAAKRRRTKIMRRKTSTKSTLTKVQRTLATSTRQMGSS
jgi:hypothetical protein